MVQVGEAVAALAAEDLWEGADAELAGPVPVTLLASEVYPASGIAVAAATCLAGTLLFAAQRATEPPLHPAHSGAPVPGARRRARGALLPAPGLVTLALVFLFFGAMLAAIDLATVDFAGHGHKLLAGVILGGYALGSMVGGLSYGSRAWRAPLRRLARTWHGERSRLTVTGGIESGLAVRPREAPPADSSRSAGPRRRSRHRRALLR